MWARHYIFKAIGAAPAVAPPLSAALEGFIAIIAVIAVSGVLAWRKERWVHGVGIALLFAAVTPSFVYWNIG